MLQLSVKRFMTVLKATADNETIDRELYDSWLQGISSTPSIPNTFAKIRAIFVAINSSSQQLELFKNIQDPKDRRYRYPVDNPSVNRVDLIQDVKTRWNSSYGMLERAWEMQDAITRFLDNARNKSRYERFRMQPTEWKHVEMLLDILQPYSQITTAIGATLSPTIHEIFRLYNWLFTMLERSENTYRSSSRMIKGQQTYVVQSKLPETSWQNAMGRLKGMEEIFMPWQPF